MGIDLNKNEDLPAFSWEEPAIPPRDPRTIGKSYQQLSLRNLMVALVYFALVFWVLQKVMTTDQAIQRVLLAVLIGLGMAVVGVWAAMKMVRYNFLAWLLAVSGYMTVMLATISVFAIPSLPFLIGAIIYLQQRRKATNQDGLLWVLTVAAERGMPLSPGVQAFSTQSSGIFGVWSAALAELLRQGHTLPDAVTNLPQVVSPSTALTIRMGQESGNLAVGLKAATLARSSSKVSAQGALTQLAYLGWVVLTASSIITFVLYFVMPKFEAIFMDFGFRLPEVTLMVIRTSRFCVDYFWIPFCIGTAILVNLTLSFFRPTRWELPLIGRFFPRRHSILILRSLAVFVQADRPIGPALQVLSQWYPTSWVRKRLNSASIDTEIGVPWAEALYASGLLGRADVGLIDAATRAGNLSWALRELVLTSERRRAAQIFFWSQILSVVATLAVGVVIFVVAVAFVLPLILMIQRLAS